MKFSLAALLLIFHGYLLSVAQDQPKPATVQEIKNAIDWAKVPRLEGATKIQTFFNHMTYKAPGTFQQAAEFYARRLGELGWKVDDTYPQEEQKDYLSLIVEKANMRLSISGYRGKPEEPMTITLMNFGNVDVRQFPKVADAEVKNNLKISTYYFSKQSPEDITSFCKKFMLERGWKEQPNESAAMWAKEGRFVLTFLQNAMECTIVVAKKKEGGCEVTYSTSVQHDLLAEDVTTSISGKEQAKPATLEEAAKVVNLMKLPRMEHAAKLKQHKDLQAIPIGTAYEVPESIDEAVNFYRKLLKDQGWEELSPDIEMDVLSRLKFEKDGFLLVFNASRDKRANTTSISLMNHGNVDLRKLPFPPGAKLSSNRTETLNTQTTLTVDEAVDFYRQELTKLGWKEGKVRGQGVIKFTQNGVSLDIEVQQNVYKKTSIKLRTSMK